MNQIKITIPFGLALIAIFYMVGAVVLLISLFVNSVQAASVIAQAHGLPASTGAWILLLFAVLALFISYGLFSLSRWGYALTIGYLVYFGSASGMILRAHPTSLHYGNLIWSVTVIIYLILLHKSFMQEKFGETS